MAVLPENDTRHREVTAVGYAARDREGDLSFYRDRPVRHEGFGIWTGGHRISDLPYPLFRHLRWEDEPMRIQITFTPVAEP